MLNNFRLRTLQIFLIALVLFFLSPGALADETVASKPPGAGTAQDPMRIENLAHLRWLGETERLEDMFKTYLIVNDIDASESANWANLTEGNGFRGIGGFRARGDGTIESLQFYGRILGNNKTISNLYVAGKPGNNLGFVRILGSGGRIENLTLANIHVEGSNHLGGMVGINVGTIVASAVSVRFTTLVSGQRRIGGLVGQNFGVIRQSYASIESITAFPETNLNHSSVGGLVGEQGPFATNAVISNSYATGTITGQSFVGGLIGYGDSGRIESSFAAVQVIPRPNPLNVHGFIGGDEGVQIIQSYWSEGFAGRSTDGSNKASKIPKANMVGILAGSMGFDFRNIWQLTMGTQERCIQGLPQLRVHRTKPSPYIESTLSGGDGSFDNPCIISNWTDLDKVRDHRSATFALSRTLDNTLSDYPTIVGTSPTKGFQPIGTQVLPFQGNLRGLGHSINDLRIERGDEGQVGLFGVMGPGGLVSDISLNNVNVTGQSQVGGLVGLMLFGSEVINAEVAGSVTATEAGFGSEVGGLVGTNNGRIEIARSTAQVSGQSVQVGGLVGANRGRIVDASASGNVTGAGQVGGLVGRSSSGLIAQAYASGNVEATKEFFNHFSGLGIAGGLVGEINLSDSLQETVATGTVQGDLIGGLVGYASGGSPLLPSILDSYSTATLKGTPGVVGALVGEINGAILDRVYFAGQDDTTPGLTSLVGSAQSAQVTDAYWDNDVVPLNTNANTVGVGKTTQEMITRSTFTDWDFTRIWALGGDRELTYPFLRSIRNLERPTVRVKLISITPANNSTGVALSPAEVLLKFNINVAVNAVPLMSASVNGGPMTWRLSTVDAQTLRIRFTFEPNKQYKITIEPGAIKAQANGSVLNKDQEVIAFRTVPFANGDGSDESPYQISSDVDWVTLTNNPQVWDQNFVLTKSITFPAWRTLKPITSFSGTFNGQNFFIQNAKVRADGSAPAGLFGTITGQGEINNLHLVDAAVAGDEATGLLAGINAGSITNSSASGVATSANGPAGGLIGKHQGDLIQRSFASATVTAPNNLGGLIGIVDSPVLTQINDVYSTSHLEVQSSTSGAGGLIGVLKTEPTITRAYAASTLSLEPDQPTFSGGLVGSKSFSNDPVITDAYWLSTWLGGNGVGGTSKTEAELKNQATFTNWDFTNTWQIVDTTDSDETPIESYPYLKALPYDAPEGAVRRMPIPGLAEKKYAGGTGESTDPFIINNWRHLNNIRTETAIHPHYRLEADLNAQTIGFDTYASASANSNQGWLPIPAFTTTGFEGLEFEGNGHSISDWVINRPSTSQVGLFAVIQPGSNVSSLRLENVDVTGKNTTGILAGLNQGSVTQVASSGSVKTVGHDEGDANVGGLVGRNGGNGSITQSYSQATVLSDASTGANVGGLVGLNLGTIADTYATGAIDGPNGLGGLVGSNGTFETPTGSIARSFATGIINNQQPMNGVQGLVGEERTTGGVADAPDISPNSFWDIDTTGQLDPGDVDVNDFPSPGVGKTTAQMKSIETFTSELDASLSWDFDTVWDIVNISQGVDTIVSYPVLRNNRQSPEPGRDYLDDFEVRTPPSQGTPDNPHRITTWRHLANIARAPSAHFILENDLVASESDADYVAYAASAANGGLGWKPIEGDDISFTGSFDGNGHTISGLVIQRPDEDNVGLFAHLGDSATVKNLTIQASIEGRSNVGVMAGLSGQATLSHITVLDSSLRAGSVDTLDNSNQVDPDAIKSSNAGGLIGKVINDGQMDNITVTNLVVNSAGARVGGLVGYLENGDIIQSHAETQISAPAGVGGLVGRLSTRSGSPISTITNTSSVTELAISTCPTTGLGLEFENEEGFGGLVGTAGSSGAQIEQSYADISMTFTDACQNIGGLVGYTYSGTIRNSYVVGHITAGDQSQHIGTLVGEHVNNPRIINSHGSVSIAAGANSSPIGGLIGSSVGFPRLVSGEPSIQTSFYNLDLPGQSGGDCDTGSGDPAPFVCGEGKTTSQLKDQATFSAWSLGSDSPIWQMASGDVISYPYLINPAQDPAPGLEGLPMVLVFDTNKGDGKTVSIPVDGEVNIRVDWGDGNESAITSAGFVNHTYTNEGIYTVKIFGELGHYGRRNGNGLAFPNAEKLTRVVSFGNVGLKSLAWAFKNAVHLIDVPSQLPTSVTRLRATFENASSFDDPDISAWNIDNVVDIVGLFAGATEFNQPLDDWDTSKIKSMYRVFANTERFNQPLDGWDVLKVRSFNRMFIGAKAFNQDLNSWDVSSATNLGFMFSGAESFNGNITSWKTDSAANMRHMFSGARSFNQAIGNWDVSGVSHFNAMFGNAVSFNQPLNNWIVNEGENFSEMFAGAYRFNHPLNNWNVSNATTMRRMFLNARSFNQSLASWSVGKVTDFESFLDGTSTSVANYDALLTSLGNQQSLQDNVTLTVGSVRYNEGPASIARAKLIDEYGWTIVDDGMLPKFSGGDGKLATPHLISSLDDLRALSENPNAWGFNFTLTQSIDASDTADWNDGKGFSPIGNAVVPFSGSFDGNGHSISNLTIARADQESVGLFGDVTGMVDSLRLLNIDVEGFNRVGGLVGHNEGAILDVAITGEVRGSAVVGGVLGFNGSFGEVSSVASHAKVTGANAVGGLIGEHQGVLLDAYSEATLSSNGTVGGLVGILVGDRSVIERSYSASSLSTSGQGQQPGGVAGSVGRQVASDNGEVADDNGGQVNDTYFIGDFAEAGLRLASADNYSIDAVSIEARALRGRESGIGVDPNWKINAPSGEWALFSVDNIQADGQFYRSYPWLKILNYDAPGTTVTGLNVPGLIKMPLPPVIDPDGTSITNNTLTLAFSIPANTSDATVTGFEYSLNDGDKWQPVDQISSPITVNDVGTASVYLLRIRAQTDQGVGPRSEAYRLTSGSSIFQDRFQSSPSPQP